jgi:hypothetical protein
MYDDGTLLVTRLVADYMHATGVDIEGTINATSGKIGNMTIGDVENTIQQTKKLDILSNLGYNFKVGNGASSPEQLELIASPIGFDIDPNSIVWYGTSTLDDD